MAVGVAVPPDESFRRLETATGLTSLPASGHTVLTLILRDGCQTDASCQLTARVPSSHRDWGLCLRHNPLIDVGRSFYCLRTDRKNTLLDSSSDHMAVSAFVAKAAMLSSDLLSRAGPNIVGLDRLTPVGSPLFGNFQHTLHPLNGSHLAYPRLATNENRLPFLIDDRPDSQWDHEDGSSGERELNLR
jgi:hypothetical protein